MFGFYSSSLDELPNEDSYIYKDIEIKKHINELILDPNVEVYIMWKKSISWWEKLLGIKFDSSNIINRVKIVNGGKCHCNIYLSAAVDYKNIINS